MEPVRTENRITKEPTYGVCLHRYCRYHLLLPPSQSTIKRQVLYCHRVCTQFAMQPKTYTTLFVCLIVATLVSTAPSNPPQRQCVDGKSYHDGCNVCFCAGGATACSRKACFTIDEVHKKIINIPTKQAPEDFWMPMSA